VIESETSRGETLPDDLAELRLDGQVAIVTGGAQGMGLTVARRLGIRGARVAILDLKTDGLQDALGRLAADGIEVVGLAADVTSSDDVEGAVGAVVERWDRVDVLVNCAGIAGGNAPVRDLDDQRWAATISVNLDGTFRMCRAVVPYMEAQAYGRIVNVASMAGKEGNPNAAHYSAAKAGVIALTKSLGKELATAGVLVNVIVPAVIETPMVHDVTPPQLDFMLSKIPMGRMGQPEEVARLVAFLASRQMTYSTGAAFDISGGRATY
jgi:3-oxoacyl-[acyl-carrier protein] reductase